MKHVMNLTVIKAPNIDREKLRIRISSNDKPKDIKWYDYIELKNVQNGKKIVCKLHGDDIPDIKDKRSSVIHINEPLRYKLNINDCKEYKFEIEKKTRLFAWCYFIRYHPDDIVSVAYLLAIIAIISGFISIVIAVCT